MNSELVDMNIKISNLTRVMEAKGSIISFIDIANTLFKYISSKSIEKPYLIKKREEKDEHIASELATIVSFLASRPDKFDDAEMETIVSDLKEAVIEYYDSIVKTTYRRRGKGKPAPPLKSFFDPKIYKMLEQFVQDAEQYVTIKDSGRRKKEDKEFIIWIVYLSGIVGIRLKEFDDKYNIYVFLGKIVARIKDKLDQIERFNPRWVT